MLSLGGRISILPALAAKTSPLTDFAFRELREPSITREICLITRHQRSFSPNTQRLLDILMATISGTSFLHGARAV